MKKLVLLPLAFTVALLASCASFLAVHEFEGTATVDGAPVPLLFRFTTYEGLVRGSYFVDGAIEATGNAEGTLSGTTLLMTLTEGDCVYDFEGIVNSENLNGAYLPRTTGCGAGGTWTLQYTGDGF